MQYGQTRPFEPGRPIELADAQMHGEGGRRAAARQRARRARRSTSSASRWPTRTSRRCACSSPTAGAGWCNAGRNSTTNDLGQFRLLRPARRASTTSAPRCASFDSMVMDMMGGAAPAARPDRTTARATPPTYYPGTPNAGEAQRVTLAVGQELGSVDIAAAAGEAGEDHRQRRSAPTASRWPARWSC